MPQTQYPSGTFTSPWMMLISGAIAGYFGFSATYSYTSTITGEFLLFVPLYEWSLKGAAIAFLVAGVIAFVRPVIGEWIYGGSGLLAAAGLLAAGFLDVMDQQHMVQSPFLTFLFAVIIAIASCASIRDACAKGSEYTGPSI
jgi:hypothetical protein